jgi:hypothetical protein
MINTPTTINTRILQRCDYRHVKIIVIKKISVHTGCATRALD